MGKSGFIASLFALGAMIMASVTTLPSRTPPMPVASGVSGAVANHPAAAVGSYQNTPSRPSYSSMPSAPYVPSSGQQGFGANRGAMPPGAMNRQGMAGMVGRPFGMPTIPAAGLPSAAHPPGAGGDDSTDSDENSDDDTDKDMQDNDNSDDNSAIDMTHSQAVAMSDYSRFEACAHRA